MIRNYIFIALITVCYHSTSAANMTQVEAIRIERRLTCKNR